MVAMSGFGPATAEVESEDWAGERGKHRYDPFVLVRVQGSHAEGRNDHQATNAHECQHTADGPLRKVETAQGGRIRGRAEFGHDRIAQQDNHQQDCFGDEQEEHSASFLERGVL